MNEHKFSKSDIIGLVAEKTGLPKRTVKAVVDQTFAEVTDIVVNGGSVTFQGFGRIFSKTAQPRSFRKINSDEMVTVDERNLPKMKFSRNLIASVKG